MAKRLTDLRRRINRHAQVKGLRAYLRDVLVTRESLEAERMLDSVIDIAIEESERPQEPR